MGSRSAALALALGLAMTLSIGVAGCGADSLSAQQLRARAVQICSAAGLRTDAIATPVVPGQGARYLSQGAQALAPELRALNRLRPPRDMTVGFHTALSAGARELRALRSTVRGLRAGNDPVVAIKTLQQELAPLQARADGAWASLGVPACASR